MNIVLVLALAVLPVVSGTSFAQGGLAGGPGTSSMGESAGRTSPDVWPGATLPLAGPVDAKEYIVGPGDVFQLSFSGRLARTLTLQVGAEGTIYVPGTGPIAVAGQTLDDARQTVAERLATDLRGVVVDLRLVRTRAMKVYLAGEVRVSGPITVPATSHVSDVLPDSIFTEHASHRRILLRRKISDPSGEQLLPADLDRFRLLGDRSGDPVLRGGDVIVVPTRTSTVAIEGAVARPGSFELGPRDSLRTLLALAGDLLPSVSDQALFMQFTSPTVTESTWFATADLVSGRFNPVLHDGDRAFFYFVPRYHEIDQAYIYGEIQRPGAYPIQPGLTRITDLVESAGGFLDRADLSTIRVFRGSRLAKDPDPELARLSKLSRREMTSAEYEMLRARLAARSEDFRIDWRRVRESPDLNLRMQNGDVVRVDPVSASVRVDGEVRRPGAIAFVAGRTVSEYIRLAGGYSRIAARGKVRITSMANGQTILAKDAHSVAPGDLIWVPERGDSSFWQNSQTIILVLAQIATIILAVKR